LLSEIEGQRKDMLKALRTAVRLKHSLNADAELRRVLPEFQAAVDKAVQSGKAYNLDIRSVLEGE